MSNLGISNFGISKGPAGGLVVFTFGAVVASAMGPVLVLSALWAVVGGLAAQPRRPVREASPFHFEIPMPNAGHIAARVISVFNIAKTSVHCNRNYCNAQIIS